MVLSCSAKLDENQAARDRDQKYYKDQIAKLQAEIEKVKKVTILYQIYITFITYRHMIVAAWLKPRL